MSIEDKFRQFERFIRSERPAKKSLHLETIAAELSAEIRETPQGNYLIKETRYRPGDIHGQFSFANPDLSRPLNFDNYSCPPEGDQFGLNDIVVVDTETTGLSGGTGTVPFLVGLGFFREGEYIVRQHFLPDLSEEGGYLNHLFDDLPGDMIVSFNGKAFDLPLLTTRFLIQRLGSDFFQRRHLDVLFTLRRFFRMKFPDCTLKTAEVNLLNFERLNDIPSEQIPQIYFDYLRSGETKEIYQVIIHNLWDIVSTMAVMVELHNYVERVGRDKILSDVDSWSLGKFYLSRRDYDRALDNFSKSSDTGAGFHEKNIFQASLICKRREDYQTALEYWRMLSESINPHYFHALEELAKYHEHSSREYDSALRFCQKALESISTLRHLDYGDDLSYWDTAFSHRSERLRTKLSKSN